MRLSSATAGAGAQAGAGETRLTLRQAARKLMKNPLTSHPFYWAGFVLVVTADD